MNYPSRCIVFLASVAICAGGWISTARDRSGGGLEPSDFNAFDPLSDYRLASGDLQKFSYARLEELVRADAAIRFPNARMELGSIKVERGMLNMTVVLFGPNRHSQAVLYALVPEKNSWKISSARRLWFVPPSQIARGLRV